jgi:hypothetical protein
MVIERMVCSLSSGHRQGYTVAPGMVIEHMVMSLSNKPRGSVKITNNHLDVIIKFDQLPIHPGYCKLEVYTANNRSFFSVYTIKLIPLVLSLHSNHSKGYTVAPPMVIKHVICRLSSGDWQGYTVAWPLVIEHMVTSLTKNLEEVSN